MKPRLFSLVIVPALAGLAGCAARPDPSTPATVTAAEIPSATPSEEATEQPEAPAPREAAQEPEGDPPVCRAKSPGGGTTELILEWKGDEAKGVLRTVAPSGNVTEQKVVAQRHKGMIVADDIHAKDLVDHAAIVRTQDGRPYILLSDHEQIWTACE